MDAPRADPALAARARELEGQLKDLQVALVGDSVRASKGEPTPSTILSRVSQVIYGHWYSSADATATHRRNYEIAAEQFGPVLAQLRQLILTDLVALENSAEAAGAPWTPGRVPNWK